MNVPREKAAAATEGLQECIMEAQLLGAPGLERAYFRYTIFEFDETARLVQPFDNIPVREIDPACYELNPTGGMTSISSVLQPIRDRLQQLMEELQVHPERDRHPLPLVVLLTDGCHNTDSDVSPESIADEIKAMNLDGDPVVIAVAGVAVGSSDLDESLMQRIASPGCYLRIEEVSRLREFLAVVGSTSAPTPTGISQVTQSIG